MFKYILLCSLLAHSTWAKPVEYHPHQVEVSPHVVFVGPHHQVAVDSVVPATPVVHHPTYVRYIAPHHDESVVYVPVGGVHHNAEVVGRSSDGVHGKQLSSPDFISEVGLVATPNGFQSLDQYLKSQAQKQVIAQQQQELQQKQQQIQQQIAILAQQEQIKLLEQKLQPPKQNSLIALETPLISGAINLPTTELLNVVGGTIGGAVGGFLSPLLKPKSLYVVEHPHHIVDYVSNPVVLSSVPVPAATVKSRRSVVAVGDIDQVAKVVNVEEQVKESRSVAAAQPSEENKEIQQVVDEQAAVASDVNAKQYAILSVPESPSSNIAQAARTLEAEQEKVEEKIPAAGEEPSSDIPLDNSSVSLDFRGQ